MLQSERLIIKPLTYEQLIKYVANDNYLEQELNVNNSERVLSPELREAMEQTILPGVKASQNYFYYILWIIIDRTTNNMVGDLCLIGPPDEDGMLEIGYGTYEKFHGHGYMSEAVGLILDWACDESNLNGIKVSTDKSNIASYKVLLKNNFTKTGEEGDLLHWEFITSNFKC